MEVSILRLITIITLCFLLSTQSAYSHDKVDKKLHIYDANIIARIHKAIKILKIEGIDLKDYKRISYSIEKKHYVVAFLTGVYFMEQGPAKSPDLEMYFDIKSGRLACIRASLEN